MYNINATVCKCVDGEVLCGKGSNYDFLGARTNAHLLGLDLRVSVSPNICALYSCLNRKQ